MSRTDWKKVMGITAAVTGAAFVGLSIAAILKKKSSVYEEEPEQKNSFEGKKVIFVADDSDAENADGIRGHLKAAGESDYEPSFYEKYVKRFFDVILSFAGLVVLSPVMGLIALAIKIEDPGPVLFTQKRLGKNKQYFKLHKFRSMKMCTPHDVPTHMLDNPDQYITKVGKFIRAHSLDELPQIWDIFIGNMSVIGPRPGLWNQDLLTSERDKYGANDVKPGLTGWAQINGRDELEIPEKAKLDGEYVSKLGPGMDAKVFLGSLHVFGKDDSVVEGGTGEMKKNQSAPHRKFSDGKNQSAPHRSYTDGKSRKELAGHIGFGERVEANKESHKKVLITAEHSFIGGAFAEYAKAHYGDNYETDFISTRTDDWKKLDFSKYDVIFHVAGLAHSDVGNVSDDIKENYYRVNTDLTAELAQKAKAEGVKEFVFMSSMIVYGDSAPFGVNRVIGAHTVPKAANFYGDSKLQADVFVRSLATDSFKVIVLRPPMVYGRGSKGNYNALAKFAKMLPVFPDVDNERSMIYIDNLCEMLCLVMLIDDFKENAVVLIPQNAEWTKTSRMVKEIAKTGGKVVHESAIFAPAVALGGKIPGKIGELVNKAFGNYCYEHSMSEYEGIDYQKIDFRKSIELTEGLNR